MSASGFQRPLGPVSLPSSMQRSVEHKHAAQAQVAWTALRERAHAIKARAIADLDRLLVRFEREFEARGGTVLWARTAEEAAALFVDICKRHGASSVVKGKSMLSEELELNRRLEGAGIEPVETDMGEFIVQLAGQRPSHIIAPAVHLSREDVGALFRDKLGVPYSDDPARLIAIASRRLRERYLQAGVGMTGANFAIAETGTIVVVENEGNGGLSAAVPPVHVVVAGIEKVIPTLDDLLTFLPLLSRAGTGQKLTTYTHFFLGPEPGKAAYCIMVDAGRTQILRDAKIRESLYCIKCGACLSVCPIYRRTGGWAYGPVYAGPIGAILTPAMLGVRHHGEPTFASTLCGACREECPVDIDLPHQLAYMRSKAVLADAPAARPQRATLRWFARAMRSLGMYGTAANIARAALWTSTWSPWKPEAIRAWTSSRELPRPAARSFKTWWRKRQ